jgi:hypothetical protein
MIHLRAAFLNAANFVPAPPGLDQLPQDRVRIGGTGMLRPTAIRVCHQDLEVQMRPGKSRPLSAPLRRRGVLRRHQADSAAFRLARPMMGVDFLPLWVNCPERTGGAGCAFLFRAAAVGAARTDLAPAGCN